MAKKICVIGAGIVGLACSASLTLEGHDVLILDPREPGTGSSAGNPGGISASSVLPAASPGVLAKVPGWLLDRDGPLTIRPGYFPALAPWLLRFVASSRPQTYQAGIQALWALTSRGKDSWERLLGRTGASELLLKSGNLIVYRSQQQYDAETASWNKRAAMGLNVKEVPEAQLREMVPQLSPGYRMARMVHDNARLRDPLEVSQRLARWIAHRGSILREEARQIVLDSSGRPTVVTPNRRISVDAVVIAAGAASRKLATQVGVRAPLQPERGYSITYDHTDIRLGLPVFSPSEKIMVSPLGDGLRLAGSAEFSGPGYPPNWKRAESLERLGRAILPDLPPLREARKWAGDRPSTPDGLPLLGPSCRSPNVICAFGHGHLGVTSAAVTAESVTALIAGREPALDLSPYRADRFGFIV